MSVSKLLKIAKSLIPHLQNNFQNVNRDKNHLLLTFSVILIQYSVILGEIVSGEVVLDAYLHVVLFAVPCRSGLDRRRTSGGSDPASKSSCRYSEFLSMLQKLHLRLLFQ